MPPKLDINLGAFLCIKGTIKIMSFGFAVFKSPPSHFALGIGAVAHSEG